ncbi:hypothetical protein BQ8794_240289 [Mesorhizobium prunaredense]|uniref:Uncharacterized protein n=1 Tax=Mesorhizobium prunaredense TaxID=1631249 RepID=A0A1R3V8C5_9HYPH|nr:hypothetical protein BQ8794_240289 [Mesorhizobium prunaredense]
MRHIRNLRLFGRGHCRHPRLACPAAPGPGGSGIVSYDGTQFHVERHVGLIGDTFTKQPVHDRLKGTRAIGHTRYATAGGPGLSNVQPFFAEWPTAALHCPQRQHHQCGDPIAYAAETGFDLLVDLGHRNDPDSHRNQQREGRQFALHRCGSPTGGRVLIGSALPHKNDRLP